MAQAHIPGHLLEATAHHSVSVMRALKIKQALKGKVDFQQVRSSTFGLAIM